MTSSSSRRSAVKLRILMVCMGNICRSPTAEAVLRHRLLRHGLADRVELDSAGTQAYHIGKSPDERSIAHAARRGYDLSNLCARKVTDSDFETFDLILAMDNDNLRELMERCPEELQGRIHRFMDFAPEGLPQAVPDPYYGGAAGFERVLDLIEVTCDGLIARLYPVEPVESAAGGEPEPVTDSPIID